MQHTARLHCYCVDLIFKAFVGTAVAVCEQKSAPLTVARDARLQLRAAMIGAACTSQLGELLHSMGVVTFPVLPSNQPWNVSQYTQSAWGDGEGSPSTWHVLREVRFSQTWLVRSLLLFVKQALAESPGPVKLAVVAQDRLERADFLQVTRSPRMEWVRCAPPSRNCACN